MDKKLLIVGILFIFIGAAGAVFTAKDYFNQDTVLGEESFSAERINEIILDSDTANIHILPSDSNHIEVKWEGFLQKWKLADNAVTFQEEADKLKIMIGKKHRFPLNLNISILPFFKSMKVDVYVPDKQYQSIAIHNKVGKTTMESIKTNRLQVETDVSNIDINGVTADTIEAKSNVGNIHIQDFTGAFHGQSDVGNIKLKLKEITSDMNITSDVGNVEITLDEKPENVTFNGTSDVGSIKMFNEKGNVVSREAKHIVTITTKVGNIKVQANEG